MSKSNIWWGGESPANIMYSAKSRPAITNISRWLILLLLMNYQYQYQDHFFSSPTSTFYLTPQLVWASLCCRLVMGQYLGSSGDVISHLNISSLQSSDGGLYQCSAANSVGRARHQANINIYGQFGVLSLANTGNKTSIEDFNGLLKEKT